MEENTEIDDKQVEKGYSRPKVDDVHIGYEYEWCGTSLQWVMFNPSEPEEHMKPLTPMQDNWTKKVVENEEDIKWLIDMIESPNAMIRVKTT